MSRLSSRSAVCLKLAGLMCFAIATLPVAAAAQDIGTVRTIQAYGYGTPPQGARNPKYPRDRVVPDEFLETVPKGGMIIRFRDETELTLGENARVVVDKFVYDPRSGQGEQAVSITRGAFRYVSGKMNEDGIKIETPVSTIGVRGTILVGNHDEATNTTDLNVVEGEAIVTPKFGGNPFTMPFGTTISMRGGAGPQVTGPVAGFVATKQQIVDRLGLTSIPNGYVQINNTPGTRTNQKDRSYNYSSSPSP